MELKKMKEKITELKAGTKANFAIIESLTDENENLRQKLNIIKAFVSDI